MVGVRMFAKEVMPAFRQGIALFKYADKVGGADVIFGEADESTQLGAFTLEALGLMLDPLKRELKPLPMILARTTSRYTH